MKDKRFNFVFVSFVVLVFIGILFTGGCSQYDYSSPSPGTINIRLRTISNNLAFDPLNNFVLKLTQVNVERDDGKLATIYEDTKAIGRTTNLYNTLDPHARDSDVVIGAAFLPPGKYIAILLLVTPATEVILDGYRNIPVATDPDFNPLLVFGINPYFEIKELTATNIVITIDLDKSLLKRANSYLFRPVYQVTSIH